MLMTHHALAETRAWVVNVLAAIRPGPARAGKKRPMIDAW